MAHWLVIGRWAWPSIVPKPRAPHVTFVAVHTCRHLHLPLPGLQNPEQPIHERSQEVAKSIWEALLLKEGRLWEIAARAPLATGSILQGLGFLRGLNCGVEGVFGLVEGSIRFVYSEGPWNLRCDLWLRNTELSYWACARWATY